MSANGVKADGTPYQVTKYEAEEYLKASGLDWTIFRPSVIFGDPGERMEFATQLASDIIRPPLPAPLFFDGVSPLNAGQFRLSPVHVEDVAQAFETYHVFEEHRYYYLNQENNPFAVIALQNDYTFRGKNLWRQFDPHSDMLKKIVDLVEGFPVYYSRTYGSYILDR